MHHPPVSTLQGPGPGPEPFHPPTPTCITCQDLIPSTVICPHIYRAHCSVPAAACEHTVFSTFEQSTRGSLQGPDDTFTCVLVVTSYRKEASHGAIMIKDGKEKKTTTCSVVDTRRGPACQGR